MKYAQVSRHIQFQQIFIIKTLYILNYTQNGFAFKDNFVIVMIS